MHQTEDHNVKVVHRIGHEYQWTHSKAASTSGPGLDSVSASWNCAVPFDVHGSPEAVHLGVYAAQPSPPPASVDKSSSSFFSVVSSQSVANIPHNAFV